MSVSGLMGRVVAAVVAAVMVMGSASAAYGQAPGDLVKRGEYLARAGDCFSCHTADNKPIMSGGRQLETPYGTIASPNITADKETGIGSWSDDDFYKVLHTGLTPKGGYIYPVMPFDHYTKVTRDDAMAIKAYLFSIPPVHAPQQDSHLEFPFNVRESLLAWRTLFFHEGTFVPDPKLTDAENRGAYLVEGLGHCGACHTPRNLLSGSKESERLGGGEIQGQGWYAPNITSSNSQGIGTWSEQQIVDYLKAGVSPSNGNIVAGPMSEVVHTSLRYMTDQDLHSMAAYLKVVPKQALYTEKVGQTPPGTEAYLTHCASCHQQDGKGVAGVVPALAGNGTVLAGGPDNVIRTILGGMNAHGTYAAMPGYATAISDQDVADIANYVRASWGNTSPATATSAMVANLSKTTKTMLAGTGDCEPIEAKPVADAVQGPLAGLLHDVNGSNMVEQVDAILPKLKVAAKGVPQDQVVNGLIAGYCPIVRTDTSMTPIARVQQLQRFATIVYSRYNSDRADAGLGGK